MLKQHHRNACSLFFKLYAKTVTLTVSVREALDVKANIEATISSVMVQNLFIELNIHCVPLTTSNYIQRIQLVVNGTRYN